MQAADKITITGVAGKIGSVLAKDKRIKSFIGLYHNEKPANLKNGKYFQVDLATGMGVLKNYEKDFSVVVHAAAKTHIDNCEEDRKKGKEGKVWKSNVTATKNVVDFCKRYKKKLVLLSTECVFDGTQESYKEEDVPKPINWYGETKREAEKLVINSGLDHLIIRGVVAYGSKRRLDDIVQLMYNKLKTDGKLDAVNDQRMNPTLVKDIIDSIFILLAKGAQGIYHVAGSSVVTPCELARKIAVIMNINESNVKGLPMNVYFTEKRAKLRLKNSVLDIGKYEKETGVKTTSIDEGLRAIFEENWGI